MNQLTEKSRLFREISSGIAISMLIIVVTMYLPLLGFFMAMILPMPIVYFRLKLGRNSGAAIMASVFAITWSVTGGLSVDILFYGGLLLTGFFLGEFLEMRLSIEKSAIYTLLSTLGICTAAFFFHAVSTDQGVFSLVSEYVFENVKLTLSLYESMGMSQENIQLISNSVEAIQYVLVRMIPALIIIMLTFVIWIDILLIKRILARKGLHLKELQDLNQWKAPERLVWIVIFLGVIMFIPEKTIKIAAFNCIVILMPVYFFQGIAIVSFIFEKKKLPILLKLFIYSIIAIQQVLILVIVGLGFFDTWMNFRKIGMHNDLDGESSDG
ncbi:MAG: DUF2232 domain-containing protein [Desulfamplus sp.]|nr:DUF2232 domain-containing protein [Desulfamplus sp.]